MEEEYEYDFAYECRVGIQLYLHILVLLPKYLCIVPMLDPMQTMHYTRDCAFYLTNDYKTFLILLIDSKKVGMVFLHFTLKNIEFINPDQKQVANSFAKR